MTREEAWVRFVAARFNLTNGHYYKPPEYKHCIEWADSALADYDKRFGRPEESPENSQKLP